MAALLGSSFQKAVRDDRFGLKLKLRVHITAAAWSEGTSNQWTLDPWIHDIFAKQPSSCLGHPYCCPRGWWVYKILPDEIVKFETLPFPSAQKQPPAVHGTQFTNPCSIKNWDAKASERFRERSTCGMEQLKSPPMKREPLVKRHNLIQRDKSAKLSSKALPCPAWKLLIDTSFATTLQLIKCDNLQIICWARHETK